MWVKNDILVMSYDVIKLNSRWNMKLGLKSSFLVVFLVICLALVIIVVKKPKHSNDKPLATAKPLVVGFVQLGSESAWRNANSASIQKAAHDIGFNLIFKNAEGDQALQKQIIHEFILEQVDVIMFSPIVDTGWDEVLTEAKKAKIPVILTDRAIKTKDLNLYAVTVGSDFLLEGRRAGKWLFDNVPANKHINVVELRGLKGSTPTEDRAKGFRQIIASNPNIQIIDSQTGDFIKARGNLIMTQMLKKHGKEINVVFAHNDDMALGAIQAIESYGLKPGKDILIVSVDGERAALQAIKDGKSNVSVECTPLLGPVAMEVAKELISGKKLPKKIISKEQVFTTKNVDKELPNRTY